MSMLNFPPFFRQIEDFTSVIVSVAPSGMSSNRNPMESPAEHSRHASRRPQGFQVPSPGRRISQAPGFDLLTLSLPGEGTNGVTIDAAATGEPDRSWMVMDQPFRSLTGFSLSSDVLKHLVDVLDSENEDLEDKEFKNKKHITKMLVLINQRYGFS